MEPWLTRDDLINFIGSQEIPASFNEKKLDTTVQEVVEGWLADLLTATYVTPYRVLFNDYADVYKTSVYPEGNDPDTDLPYTLLTLEQYTNGRALKQFIAYATWSIYIKKSNAINTDTGIVAKLNPDSERISDRQRTELSNYYQGLAERKALELQRLFIPIDTCVNTYGGSGRPILRKAQPRSPSRLGN